MTPYAAIWCPEHKSVDIDVAEYDRQMDRPNARWQCPKCGGVAGFDDERFEALHPSPPLAEDDL